MVGEGGKKKKGKASSSILSALPGRHPAREKRESFEVDSSPPSLLHRGRGGEGREEGFLTLSLSPSSLSFQGGRKKKDDFPLSLPFLFL